MLFWKVEAILDEQTVFWTGQYTNPYVALEFWFTYPCVFLTFIFHSTRLIYAALGSCTMHGSPKNLREETWFSHASIGCVRWFAGVDACRFVYIIPTHRLGARKQFSAPFHLVWF